MSNQSTQTFGTGLAPRLRSPRSSHGGRSLCLVLGLLFFASSAMAAEIMEVRVGRHAEFTRVVFELDRAAGYRIERANPTSDVAELVISLEASSIPRRIQSPKSLIEQVSIEPSGHRSIARVRLAKSGLRLKEMILANPPRIVVDVLSDAKPVVPVAKAKPKPKAKATPKPAPKPEPTFEDIVAQNSKQPAPAAEPKVAVAPKPAPKLAARPAVEPAPAPAPAAKPAPKPAPKPVEVAKVAPPPAPKPEPVKPVAPAPAPKPMVETADAAEPSTSIPMKGSELDSMPEASRAAMADAPAAESMPEPAPDRKPRAMVVKSKPAADAGGGWMTWGLAAVGVVLLVLGGVVVARKRRGGADEDSSEFFGDVSDGDADSAQMGEDDNPFGLTSDDSQMTLGGADSGGATNVPQSDEEKESESIVFGEAEENSMEDMEVISREQVDESLGGMPSAAGVPEEFQQMMREMNRRVESLEGRIDELVDARDRLERQVAAQTEELRVQRAAIARTQRAVRNLARPEDGEGEVEATEPALRDPNQ